MLPIERLNQINKIIHNEENIKISELSKRLGVSEMTIHRDVKSLIEDGIVAKTFGGISLLNKQISEQPHIGCIICSRKINERIAYRLILADDKIEIACCAHCGLLRHQQREQHVMQAICYDFLRQTTISVQSAWFVMDTTVNMGCCQPQVLTFEWEEHAVNFVKGFGGKVLSFQQATEIVLEKMSGKENKCH